ncbi:MAG: hypothetical protein H2060_08275 [Azoarcus sp.]|nr:hypothetical protein [Azoarcus sp.]
METFALFIALALGAYVLAWKAQQQRIALLGGHLQNYRIEKLMADLNEGYMRALGEESPQRREQILELMQTNEASLSSQFSRFAAEMAKLDAESARVSRISGIPFADRLFPGATFDLRKALDIHARGIANVVQNLDNREPKDRAFVLSAEMLLMQHTCHWFCKSKTVASARLMARHKTTHQQVVDAVSPETRREYVRLIGG